MVAELKKQGGYFMTREETETLLLEASRRKMGEISGMLMEFKYHKFPEKKKKFEF